MVKRRLPVILAIFAIEAGLLLAFSSLPLTKDELQSYSTSWNQTMAGINGLSPPLQVGSIFWNNAVIAVGMFGPVIGQLTFASSIYSTGRVLEVIAIQLGGNSNAVFFELYLYPHTWIETFAYAVAFGEGLVLLWAVARGGKRNFEMARIERELPLVLLSLVAAVVLLAIAAVFEVGEGHLVAGSQPVLALLSWIPFALLLSFTVFSIRALAAPRPGVVGAIDQRLEARGIPRVPALSGAGTDAVRLDIEDRVKTDRLVSSAWVALPAVSVLLVVAFVVYTTMVAVQSVFQSGGSSQATDALASLFAYFGYFALVPNGILAVLLVLVYKLIKRRNEHFGRQRAMFSDLLALLGAEAEGKNLTAEFEVRVAPARSTLDEIDAKETQREGLLWVIASLFVGVLLPFVIYFLMKDYYNHERREERFLQQLSIAASSTGVHFPYYGRASPLPNRSFAAYVVLTVVTYGFFTMYWVYWLINDPNEHFMSQWDIEDRLYGDLNRPLTSLGRA